MVIRLKLFALPTKRRQDQIIEDRISYLIAVFSHSPEAV